MFFHILKYKLIHLFHNKETTGWVFLFPIALGTLFYLGFGNLLTDNDTFEPIPIAAVSMQEDETSLKQVVNLLSQDAEDQLLSTTWTTKKEAEKLLNEGTIDGILFVRESPSLTIKENGLNQSILSSFLSQYLSQSYAMEQIEKEHPEQAEQAARQLFSDVSYNKEVSVNQSSNNNLVQYFYALIAMVCLYGGLLGQDAALSIQPHLSPVGARKNIAPVHKLKVILADFSACIIVNYLSVLLVFFYLIVVLKIDFGNRIPQALLTSLAGSVIGVSFGVFSASIGKGSRATKEGIFFSITMLCCFMGGLMINTMQNIVAHHAPWINKINPAALISDSFYSLNVYTDYSRYQKNLFSMLVIAGIFCLGSYLVLRKKTMN